MIVAYTPGRYIHVTASNNGFTPLRKVLWASPRIVVECVANCDVYYADWVIDSIDPVGECKLVKTHRRDGIYTARVPIPHITTFTCECGSVMRNAREGTYCPHCHPDSGFFKFYSERDRDTQGCYSCQMYNIEPCPGACPDDIPF